ncbi:hypothetical protein [Glycomyces sp. YM15]|uniref:hypothetical protein n=1 Tax=Glycomyces sp. YM15 TaxID=2800446 RepID=UPI001966B7FF|nr:hypothetical protein [Glycomyces sp. YM15]
MTTPERDPLNAMFDRYAATTAAETTRATPGQLRRRMHRHRAARVAAAGVAAAVLAVPGGWMLQQAGASDEPLGAADQGATSEEPPCVEGGRYAILAEGTTIEDYLAAEEMGGGVIFSQYETIEALAADPALYRFASLAEGAEEDAFKGNIEDAKEVQEEHGGYMIVVEFYGTFERDAPVEVLYPCEEPPVDERSVCADVDQSPTQVPCEESPTETPSEEGLPGDGPTEAEPEIGEEPTGVGEEPTGPDEEPTEAGDESPTEEPSPGDEEEPTASEQATS